MARPSTREKLLDTAEELFAEHGLAGVSLRTINAEAGLSPAALHYHFGTQQALVEALLERRMPSLMERRRGEAGLGVDGAQGGAGQPALGEQALGAIEELLAGGGTSHGREIKLIV